jgi:serine/threonine protein kinase
MGEVYRALDRKLDRTVAIKILPEALANDPERIARFEREAKTLAALNHPNIAHLYGLEESDGMRALVMELVEGPTLADRIAQGPIPLAEALPIARQIAEALEAAHEQGVIHRDLKPANVKVKSDGTVKVLDFGLAKALDPAASGLSNLANSPTLIMQATQAGVILGTAAYMSPEQARGGDVDKRTDLWAFGVVLYEMLTGSQLFGGATMSDTLAHLLTKEPDWSALPAITPAPIRRLLRRCLERDRKQRLPDAAVIRFEIDEALAPVSTVSVSRPSRRPLILVAGLLLIAISTTGVFWLRPQPRVDAPRWSGTLLSGPPNAYGPRVSPDGSMLAFQAIVDGQSQVGVMNPKSGNWTLLTHEKGAGIVTHAGWSRDGTKIYFSRDQSGLFSIPALGGDPRRLLDEAIFAEALADDSLIVQRNNGDRIPQLYRFSLNTDTLEPLNALIPDLGNDPAPRFRSFPAGDRVVFFGVAADEIQATPSLRVLDLKSGKVRPLNDNLQGRMISGFAVDPRDESVLVDVFAGDSQQVFSISTKGIARPRMRLTLTDRAPNMDIAADGSLYVDQISRSLQILRFSESDITPAILASVASATFAPVLELPDGRLLLTAIFQGRPRLVVAKPSGEQSPFVETDVALAGPVTMVGLDHVAFRVWGKGSGDVLAIASVKEGRITARLKIPAGVNSITASPDGTTLFYSVAGSIWSVQRAGGEPKKLAEGDAVTFDPRSKRLLIQVSEHDKMRLVRVPMEGGTSEPVPVRGEAHLAAFVYLGPRAVRADGQIVATANVRDSWFAIAGVLNPITGEFRRTRLRYDADITFPSWNSKGEIVAGGSLWRSSMWRFQAEKTP